MIPKSDSEIKAIHEHRPRGQGDKWYYMIEFEDGTSQRVFEPNTVFFKAVKNVCNPDE